MTYEPARRFRSPIVGDLNLPPHGGEDTAPAPVDVQKSQVAQLAVAAAIPS